MEGLWHAHFSAGPMQGDGLAVLRNGEILGGDLSHTYTGSYQEDGSHLYANVLVRPYAAGNAPAEIEQQVTFFLKGTLTGDLARVTGHPDDNPDLKVEVQLHRAA
jgi:hypothetical protein